MKPLEGSQGKRIRDEERALNSLILRLNAATAARSVSPSEGALNAPVPSREGACNTLEALHNGLIKQQREEIGLTPDETRSMEKAVETIYCDERVPALPRPTTFWQKLGAIFFDTH